ncbi:hypothetical protein SHELI_v1c06350 [Spiroplasma helicoides]|uniref:Uncharacterized protein n=1 Tax=Spiroplasma helicoides TaxID=216938 RepID=A0A1B3SKY0_9MOLU|nr:hypothetical protein [Spiroplasma helicoides]AOG60586.1 hypothetical protein SHELI_v1c06350 [Spiroplasma helicoides]
MKNLFTIKNICIAGLLTALMFVIALFSSFISSLFGKSIFQVSDIVYLSIFVTTINPIINIIGAVLAGMLTDIYYGGFIYIPMTILVKILIGLIMIFLLKKIKIYYAIPVGYLPIFIYFFYSYFIYDISMAVVEAITDSIQYGVTVVFSIAITLTYDLKKLKLEKYS